MRSVLEIAAQRQGAQPRAEKTRIIWTTCRVLNFRASHLAFREDDARHRARNTAENMTTLRHFALDIIKSDTKHKLGVANTRKRAGWDRNYLIELLTNA
jgi:predicted transposase YbfD/YdcC